MMGKYLFVIDLTDIINKYIKQKIRICRTAGGLRVELGREEGL